MPIFYPDIVNEPAERRTFSYTEKDVILYALGLGMGADPLDADVLPFVFEPALKVVPTVVTALARVGQRDASNREPPADLPPGHRISRTNRLLRVHGEQKVVFHHPIAPAATVTTETRTIAAIDKGADKGALIVSEVLWMEQSGRTAATLTTTTFARGDGGFGGPTEGGEPVHQTPVRPPDVTLDLPTRPDQALIYRLSGDLNPIHADPEIARRAGFPRPILHGLSSFGMAFVAVMKTFAGWDPTLIASQRARFSAPVLPGDTLSFAFWEDRGVISFEAAVKARGVTVLKNGMADLR